MVIVVISFAIVALINIVSGRGMKSRIRIEKAKEFLKQPEVSVKEAGVKSGYTDPNYFSRIFKKQTDMTPSEFKTRYGK